jgi:hypothetical protein
MIASLGAGDWIALVQALFLLAAAALAWRAYSLSLIEHREAREEARKAPLRELVSDVVRELKELAAAVEARNVHDSERHALLAAHQQRLAVALTFLPPNRFNLFGTEELTGCDPGDVEKGDRLRKSREEILTLFARIERGEFSILDAAPPAYQQDRPADAPHRRWRR